MKSKSKTVVIDVKKWCRGDEHNERTGKYCAVGFADKQYPTFASKALHKYVPNSFLTELRERVNAQYTTNLYSLITIFNDDLKGKERREVLKKVFKLAGYKLKFKNL